MTPLAIGGSASMKKSKKSGQYAPQCIGVLEINYSDVRNGPGWV